MPTYCQVVFPPLRYLNYRVEPRLPFDEGKGPWADFLIESHGESWYWEHCGMMADDTYPKALREEKPSAGWIGAGPYSAAFKVTIVGQGYCKCVIERKDLISFDGKPLPDPGTDMGGISGGPVLLVDTLSYPMVGVVTDRCELTFAEFEIIQFATFEGVNL